jgi:hypothetical protein
MRDSKTAKQSVWLARLSGAARTDCTLRTGHLFITAARSVLARHGSWVRARLLP